MCGWTGKQSADPQHGQLANHVVIVGTLSQALLQCRNLVRLLPRLIHISHTDPLDLPCVRVCVCACVCVRVCVCACVCVC
jgi:hypothetical protein